MVTDSSTGHLILLQIVQFKNQDPAFMEMFNVVSNWERLSGCGDLFR